MTVDSSNNVLITGYFQGTVDFGAGPLTAVSWDVYVAKYSPAGVCLLSERFGNADIQIGRSVAVAPVSGDVLVTGNFSGTIDFGGGTLTSAGSADIFLANLGP
jgi:hypothetical protein